MLHVLDVGVLLLSMRMASVRLPYEMAQPVLDVAVLLLL